MTGIGNRTELPLAATVGCACCSTPAATMKAAADVELAVEGLTCGHCVESVQKAVIALDGVESASVMPVAGGRSRLTISGAADVTGVREAVTSAGYSLIS